MFDRPGEREVPRPEMEWQVEDLLPLLEQLVVGDLLLIRSVIDSRLPATALKDMNLEEELVIQFQVAKALQSQTISGNEEANKKAQTVNSTAGVLQQLVKMQTEFHTAERLKGIESRLIKSLEKIPEHYLHEFFAYYESEEH